MPEFIPSPQLPNGLAEQGVELQARKNDPWAALAMHIGESVKEGVKNYQARQPFSPDQAALLNKGEVPANLPKSQAAPLYESANKRKEAETLLGIKNKESTDLEGLKAGHAKDIEGLKAGHATEIQKLKDETAKTISEHKEATAKSIAADRNASAKERVEIQAQSRHLLKDIDVAKATGDAMRVANAQDKWNKYQLEHPVWAFIEGKPEAGDISVPSDLKGGAKAPPAAKKVASGAASSGEDYVKGLGL